jgi:hypothetical protein
MLARRSRNGTGRLTGICLQHPGCYRLEGASSSTPIRSGGPGAILGPWPYDDVSGETYGPGIPSEIHVYLLKH